MTFQRKIVSKRVDYRKKQKGDFKGFLGQEMWFFDCRRVNFS